MAEVYPVKLRLYARRLHEANGWSAYRIRKGMMARGISPLPSTTTVWRWINEESYEDELRRKRRYGTPGRTLKKGWRLKLERMEALKGTGISCAAIAAVMKLDYDVELTREQVRHIFNGNTQPRKLLEGATA